jgi:hypothetical protein
MSNLYPVIACIGVLKKSPPRLSTTQELVREFEA